MDALVNTTYYPAILLRKRWREATLGQREQFDVGAEIHRIRAAQPLDSVAVSALEQWATLPCAAEPARGTYRAQASSSRALELPPLRANASRRLQPTQRRDRRDLAGRSRAHVIRRGAVCSSRLAHA
jgi:hypothetical protein